MGHHLGIGVTDPFSSTASPRPSPDRRRRLLVAAGAIALFLAVIGGGRVVAGRITTLTARDSASLPGMLRTTAPWRNNTAGLGARLDRLGLPPAGPIEHIHVFLAIFVHGRRVPVPADIGLAADAEAPLHVHEGEPGIVHVESLLPFWRATLGEFFDVWGVRLTSGCVGGYCVGGGAGLDVFVDGGRFEGEPRLLPLTDHADIVLVFGDQNERPAHLPTFDWSRAR